MTRYSKFAFLLLIAFSASPVFSAANELPRYFQLTVLSTNDVHGWLTPRTVWANTDRNIPDIANVCGAARRATIVRETRSSTSEPVLLVDSGDTTFGWNYIVNAMHGRADIDIMNALGYDAMVPGNHEFEWADPADVLRNIRSSRFPWVCANLVRKDSGKPFLQPYVIREFNGVRVAIFGLITASANDAMYKSLHALGLQVTDPYDTVKALVPELRKKADIVILLSHVGMYQDPVIAKEIPGIDAIFGGHSHSYTLYPELTPSGEPGAFYTGAVPRVEGHWVGLFMGKLRLIFHRDAATGRYTLMSCTGGMITIDSTIPDDPQIAKMVDLYRAKARKLLPPAKPAAPAKGS